MSGPRQAEIEACDRFLNRMAWNAATGGTDDIVQFRIDCFRFRFDTGFDSRTEYEFFQYAKTLDLSDQRAVIKLWLWLKQHRVGFRFGFQWNRKLPFLYNVMKWDDIWAIKKLMDGLDETAIMSYDLAADQAALHP